MGFQSGTDEASLKSMEDLVMGEVKRAFNPEFLNRLDEIILFNPLGDDDLLRIIDLLVGQLNDTLIHRQVQIVVVAGSTPVDPRKNVRGSQLRGAAVAAGFAEVRGRPAVGSADSGWNHQAGDTCRFMSPGKASRSGPWVRQPRSSTSESDTTHGGPDLVGV